MAFGLKFFGGAEKPKPVISPQESPKTETSAEAGQLPYEYYRLRSRDLATKIAVLEKQAANARRNYDLKAAEKLKAELAKVTEEQRQVLREAAQLRELKRQGKI